MIINKHKLIVFSFLLQQRDYICTHLDVCCCKHSASSQLTKNVNKYQQLTHLKEFFICWDIKNFNSLIYISPPNVLSGKGFSQLNFIQLQQSMFSSSIELLYAAFKVFTEDKLAIHFFPINYYYYYYYKNLKTSIVYGNEL